MESQNFQAIFDQFTPESEADINKLDLKDTSLVPEAAECIPNEDDSEVLQLEKTNHAFSVITFADWFSKYSSRISSVRRVQLKIATVNPKESIVVTVPNDHGKLYRGVDKRHLKLIENASIIPVIDSEPIDMFLYNNGYQILYPIGGDTYLKGYSVRKKFIVNICKDVCDFLIPTHSITIKRNDTECKFSSYDLHNTIEERISQNRLNIETLHILYHQSKKSEYTNFRELLEWLTTRQGGIKDVQHQLEIDTAIKRLCLDGVDYET